MGKLKPNEITEEHLEQAANAASHWTKKRMLKKIDKTIYRPKDASGYAKPRSPKDLESYTTDFVNRQLAKVSKDGAE